MKKIFLMLFGACLSAIALELAGHAFPRAFHFRPRRYANTQNPRMGYTCGSQNTDLSSVPADGVAVGDSFTNGTPSLSISDMYPNVVAGLLNKNIVSLGCPGYGTLQEEIAADGWLGRAKTKWVILEIYPGNDWLDNYDFSHWLLLHGGIPYELHRKIVDDGVSCEGMFYGMTARLVGRSVVYTVVYDFMVGQWRKRASADGWYRADPRAAQIGEYQAFAAVSRLKRLCASRRVRLLVLLVRIKSTLDEKNPSYVPIRRFLEINHIGFVDPAVELSSAERSGRELFLSDGHWNREGQKIAAELIARKMRE